MADLEQTPAVGALCAHRRLSHQRTLPVWPGVSVLAPAAASGAVDLVSSSKTARLRRRKAARHKKDKHLCESGRVPQHTRTERRRAEAERQRQWAAERSRQALLRRGAVPVLMSIGAASFAVLPSAEVSNGHRSFPHVSAAELALPDRTELPHPAEPDMTFYTSWTEPAITGTNVVVGPVDPASWDGSERYGSYGANNRGD